MARLQSYIDIISSDVKISEASITLLGELSKPATPAIRKKGEIPLNTEALPRWIVGLGLTDTDASSVQPYHVEPLLYDVGSLPGWLRYAANTKTM